VRAARALPQGRPAPAGAPSSILLETVRLAIYLNDHLAGATAARELARRSASSNRDSSYGPFLEELTQEIDEDRASLIEIMRALGVKVDHVKVVGGWTAEKLGRFKLNGSLLSYSPLSRLVELEVLGLGVQGKLALWRALELLEPDEPRLAATELGLLIARAETQLRELEEQRIAAAAEALP
jgi:hypothetical protein